MSLVEEDITLEYMTGQRPSYRAHATSDTITRSSSIMKKHGSMDSDVSDRDTSLVSPPLTPSPSPSDEEDNAATVTSAQAIGTQEFSLPPVDGGLNAYLVLIAGFCIEGVVYGIPYSYSVMQQHYQQLPEFKDASITELAIVGTLTTSLAYIGGGLVGVLGGRFSLKTMMYGGSLMIVTGLVAASFATKVWHLALSQGFVLGLGGAFVFNSFMTYVPMYWFKYRGVATGIIYAGSGIFGLICPIAVEKGLNAIGFRWTLRVIALFALVLCFGSAVIIRPRYAPDANVSKKLNLSKKDFKFIATKKFGVLGLCVFFQGLAYFIPNLFIQPYALYIGVPEQTSTTLLSILNAMTIVGQLSLGHMCDRYGYWTATAASSAVSSISTFFLWGYAENSMGLLIAYIVIFGIFGAGFTVCFPSMVYDVADADPSQFTLISGAFMLLRGIGNFVGTPLGSLFLTSTSPISEGWHGIAYFVGSTMLASAMCSIVRTVMVMRAR
ncbi:major facilitator superfamily domain-containing protein [Absidia repens]|uniref:Major facilitator superfamily domain-containing protein n=1 Tax=Absidia repens TaxID=90262 RepID=A0A1X2I467_9FUNG|nr:major facilitator superfamily domain-containing protein [Absidia repens]